RGAGSLRGCSQVLGTISVRPRVARGRAELSGGPPRAIRPSPPPARWARVGHTAPAAECPDLRRLGRAWPRAQWSGPPPARARRAGRWKARSDRTAGRNPHPAWVRAGTERSSPCDPVASHGEGLRARQGILAGDRPWTNGAGGLRKGEAGQQWSAEHGRG